MRMQLGSISSLFYFPQIINKYKMYKKLLTRLSDEIPQGNYNSEIEKFKKKRSNHKYV